MVVLKKKKMSQAYQIQKFLNQVERTFDDYGDIDSNFLYDYARDFREVFADTLEEGIELYQSEIKLSEDDKEDL